MVGGRPGPAPQTTKREWFARLIVQGVPSAEACRIVGVNPRTGKRWRHGRTITSSSGRRLHYPPVISSRRLEISSRYLSEDERVLIADLQRQGLAMRAIATKLGRSPATISRELRGNRDPGPVPAPSRQHQPGARCVVLVRIAAQPRPAADVMDLVEDRAPPRAGRGRAPLLHPHHPAPCLTDLARRAGRSTRSLRSPGTAAPSPRCAS